MGASQSISEKSIHEFTVKDAKGRDVNLSTYKGKVLLVVNVTSKCYNGFTNSYYTQLTELYSRYKDRGEDNGEGASNRSSNIAKRINGGPRTCTQSVILDSPYVTRAVTRAYVRKNKRTTKK